MKCLSPESGMIGFDSISRQPTARTLQYQHSFFYIWFQGDASLQFGWVLGQNGQITSFIVTFLQFRIAVTYCGSCWRFRWVLCNNLSTDWLHNHVVDYAMAVPNLITWCVLSFPDNPVRYLSGFTISFFLNPIFYHIPTVHSRMIFFPLAGGAEGDTIKHTFVFYRFRGYFFFSLVILKSVL